MSQTDPAQADPHRDISLTAPEEQFKQTMKAFEKFVEDITPWLLEVGSWIFGGLIAFTLLVIGSLLTIGPVDPAIKVTTAALALALPLDVTGLVLLRLVRDLEQVGFEEELAQAFQEAGFTRGSQVPPIPAALEAMRTRRTRMVLGSSLVILALSVLLTLTGIIAALWHMVWWIGVSFFAMILLSLAIVTLAIVTSQPPDSQEEKERKRRYREEITRQAKAADQKNEERV